MLLGSMVPRAAASILLITLVLWSGVRPKEPWLRQPCAQPHQGSLCEHDVSRPRYTPEAAASMLCCPVRQVTSPCFMNETCCLVQAPHEEAVFLSYALAIPPRTTARTRQNPVARARRAARTAVTRHALMANARAWKRWQKGRPAAQGRTARAAVRDRPAARQRQPKTQPHTPAAVQPALVLILATESLFRPGVHPSAGAFILRPPAVRQGRLPGECPPARCVSCASCPLSAFPAVCACG